MLKREFMKVGGPKQILRRKLLRILIGLAFLGCWLQFGQSPALALVYGLLLAGLIIASFIDFKHFIIPDEITFGGILVGFLCSVLLPQLQGQKLLFAGMLQSLLGIGVGAGLVYFALRLGKLAFGRQRLALSGETKIAFTDTALLLPDKEIPYAELFHRKSDAIEAFARSVEMGNRSYQNVSVRLTPAGLQIGDDKFSPEAVSRLETVCTQVVLPREAMGLGDVKFMAMIGAFLGWQAAIFSLLVSSLFGSIVGVGLIVARRRDWSSLLPYGPSLPWRQRSGFSAANNFSPRTSGIKTGTMFNLEQSIATWRKQMLAAGIQSPVPLDELESHLRDDVERQTKSGSTAQKEFELAVKQFGQTNTLKNEFKKIEGNHMKKTIIVTTGILGVLMGMSLALPAAAHYGHVGPMDLTQISFLLLGLALTGGGLGGVFFGLKKRRA